MRARRIAVAAALALASACAAAPAHGETLSCDVSASGSFAPGMQLVGGSGLYSLQSPSGLLNSATCSYNGGPRVASSVATEGVFVTILCGWATFDSPYSAAPTTTIDVGMDGTHEISSLRYHMELRSWLGDLRVTQVNGRPETGGSDTDALLLIRPQHSCTGEPLVGYTVDGLLSLEW